MTKHILLLLSFTLLCSGQDAVKTPKAPADDYLKYEYHTNFFSTQAKIRTIEEGFSLWMPRHNNLKQRVREKPVDLLMIGDSIVFRWERQGKKVWEEFYGDRRAVQIGSSGDYTDHILWRLQNGGVAGASPKLTVLLIGTNNTGLRNDPPKETAYGVEAIVKELKKRLPESKILLLGIFPRGNYEAANEAQKKRLDKITNANNAVNKIIKGYADEKTVFYRDYSKVFLNEKGHVDKALMPDFVHPGEAGFRVWAKAMEPFIKEHVDARQEADPPKVKQGKIEGKEEGIGKTVYLSVDGMC
ncbi:MAG: lysophospholipase L1-like esterase [Cryomorphaceae bacterium]|jgi:lysophospholipase L1-like esterase